MAHGAGIWLAAAVALGGCDVAVLRGLPAAEAREVAARLERRGVVARVVPEAGGARLEVNEAAVAEAVGAIARGGAEGACKAESGRSWLETPGEERARAEARLERELGQSITRLPGVAQARVHVTLAAGLGAIPESQTPAAASVLLVRAQAGKPVETEVRELVAGAVPGLSLAAVRVVETHEEAAAELRFARVGPIVVRQESAGLLRGWIAGTLIVQLLLAAAVLRPLLRRRRND